MKIQNSFLYFIIKIIDYDETRQAVEAYRNAESNDKPNNKRKRPEMEEGSEISEARQDMRFKDLTDQIELLNRRIESQNA